LFSLDSKDAFFNARQKPATMWWHRRDSRPIDPSALEPIARPNRPLASDRAAVLFPPSAVGCTSDGCCQGIDAADSDIFKGDDHEAVPDRRPLEFEKNESGAPAIRISPRRIDFSQEAANDSRIVVRQNIHPRCARDGESAQLAKWITHSGRTPSNGLTENG
jgi:hypothetical protein